MCGAPIVNQDLSVCYGEKRRYELPSTIEQSDIVHATSLPNAPLRGNWLYWAVNVRRIFYGVPKSKPRLCLFAFKSGSPEQTKILSVCYGGKRRYELLSMIEQSDIIRAISLPNATSSVNATLLSNAMRRGLSQKR